LIESTSPEGATADLAPTVLPLNRPRTGGAALAHRGRATDLSAAHRLSYGIEARYSSKREHYWVGCKVQFTETCDAAQPDLMTQVITTPATTPDCVIWPAIVHDLAARALLLGTHLLDSG
jgi:hypothetical protein